MNVKESFAGIVAMLDLVRGEGAWDAHVLPSQQKVIIHYYHVAILSPKPFSSLQNDYTQAIPISALCEEEIYCTYKERLLRSKLYTHL